MNDHIYSCKCGREMSAGANIEAIWSGKKEPYYRMVCVCNSFGPAAVTKRDAILKWNHYRATIEGLK